MCGIAGMVDFQGLDPGSDNIGLRMAETLVHRGPDDAGLFTDTVASLGHRRLSIIDLGAGHQPLCNEDGSVWVAFNGEIYNYRELAAQLRRAGHTFRTQTDTEVIVHLYEAHGPAFVDQLNGMFAIALWDARRRKLLLVRDRIGIKPLYYAPLPTGIAFGSELKAVTACPDVDTTLDESALLDYLTFGHIPAPRTIYRRVRKLEPGWMILADEDGLQHRQWWDIPFPAEAPPDEPHRQAEWTDRFADLLDDAIRLRMIADVPLGAFLSGGVDSSAVVAGMSQHTREPILTHTVGFAESDVDERSAARTTAAALRTAHHEVLVEPEAASLLPRLVRQFDEPFADPSALAMYHLSKVTRERVKVALSGDGGDEMLAGYRRYRFDLAESAVRQRCPAWLRRSTLGVAGRLYPTADWLPRPLRAKATLLNLACNDADGHLRSVSLRGGTLPESLLHPDLRLNLKDHDPFDAGRALHASCPSPEPLNRLLYMDMKSLMVDGILTKVDRMSMAVGLEVRVPLLDHRIVELAARMPVSLKMAPQGNKHVLRKTVARWLPPEVADRPKHGFDLPLDAWFRGPLHDLSMDALTGPSARLGQWLDRRATRRLLDQHQRGVTNNGVVLWALLNLELWARGMDASTDQSPAPPVAEQRRPVAEIAS